MLPQIVLLSTKILHSLRNPELLRHSRGLSLSLFGTSNMRLIAIVETKRDASNGLSALPHFGRFLGHRSNTYGCESTSDL